MYHITHKCFSKLEIETHDEEEGTRNWAELPEDVLSMIFLKLGYINILVYAQWVCSSWWKFSKQPHLFRSICVKNVSIHCGYTVHFSMKLSRKIAKEAIDRSCGQLVKFSAYVIADTKFLQYMSKKSTSLRCLRLICCVDVKGDRLIGIAKKLPQLEEIDVVLGSVCSKDLIDSFGRFCPRLKSCHLKYINYWDKRTVDEGIGVAIAKNMSQLRHLKLCIKKLLDDDLLAVLDGCPHLGFLELTRWSTLEFGDELKERCRNIKVVWLPANELEDFGSQVDLDFYIFT